MLAHHTYLSAASPCLLAPGCAPSLSATNYLGNQALVVLHTVPSTVVVAYQTLACCTRVHHFGLTSTLPVPELPLAKSGVWSTGNKQGVGGGWAHLALLPLVRFCGLVRPVAVFVFFIQTKRLSSYSPFMGGLSVMQQPSEGLNHRLIAATASSIWPYIYRSNKFALPLDFY